MRFSHENPDVAALYRDYLGTPMSPGPTTCCTRITTGGRCRQKSNRKTSLCHSEGTQQAWESVLLSLKSKRGTGLQSPGAGFKMTGAITAKARRTFKKSAGLLYSWAE
ncbi:MAG: iron hydrogenase small subunit [Oscillospiraceae bacterium]